MKHGWKGLLGCLLMLTLLSVSFAYPCLAAASFFPHRGEEPEQGSGTHHYLFDVTPVERASDYPVYLAAAVANPRAPHTWRLASLLLALAVAFTLLLLLSVTAAFPLATDLHAVLLTSWRMLRAPPQRVQGKISLRLAAVPLSHIL